ncbi:MAG TPA: hypothetical protein VK852_10995 [Desulfobacterales bacterium]|jgi:hypothetical protein|nr:hypothetical protein [Desulfobacterales bacterium]
MPACPVSLLQQREIEARVAAPPIVEFAALVGWEAALNTADPGASAKPQEVLK